MHRPLKVIKQIHFYSPIVTSMAIREIRNRYAGTLGGLLWSIVNPLMMVLVYWFVFSVGFKVKPAGDIPFIVVFLSGLIPWLTFSETLSISTNVLTANPHLVTKTIFPTEILPVSCLLASLSTHIIMLVILSIILLINDISLSIYNFQFFYYLIALSIFALGLSWILSAANVFWKDISHGLGVVLNIWFWFTPIVWDIAMLPPKYRFIIKLNPFFYIVDGYRSAFVYHESVFQNALIAIYFWAVAIATFLLGVFVFKKLKSEFAEVL